MALFVSQSAFIEVAFGGNFVLDPIQSVFDCCIWQEFVSDPFQSASIDTESGRKLVFGSFSHLAGGLFLVPFESASLFLVSFQSASIFVAFRRHFFFHIYTC